MDKLIQIMYLLIDLISTAYITIVIVRFLLQLVHADFYNPLSQLIFKATNPPLLTIRKLVPGFFGIDIASLVLALLLQVIALELLYMLPGRGIIPFMSVLIYALLALIKLLLNIYVFSFMLLVIISWIAPHTNHPLIPLLTSITEPILRPIRNLLPPMGGLDFSIMVALLMIYIIKILFDFT